MGMGAELAFEQMCEAESERFGKEYAAREQIKRVVKRKVNQPAMSNDDIQQVLKGIILLLNL